MPESNHSTIQPWTPAMVREVLPDVCVNVGGRLIVGEVRGRLNDFATVYPIKGFSGGGDGAGFSFAWSTIANALNSKRPLLI